MIKPILAWCVHGYTALGLVCAGGIAVAIYEGTPTSFAWAFLIMLIATLIDATDGTMARAIHIKEVLPHFDGRRLDDLIDFQTYTSLPLLLIWRADLLPPEWQPWLLAPLVASAYGFCQITAKTDDGYFLGFPSYWNIVAFYLYLLHPPAWLTLTLILFFAVMTFVPARYLYPTHRGRLNRWTNLLGAVWTVLLGWILWHMLTGAPTETLTWVSLFFPAFYLGVSWYISGRIAYRAWHQHQLHQSAPRTGEIA